MSDKAAPSSAPPRPRWRGFSFALHLLRVQGFYFCPATIQPHTSVYSGFYTIHAVIPTTPQNSAQGFAMAFPEICPILPPTIPDRQKRICRRLRHAGASDSARTHSSAYQIPPQRWTLCSSAQPPIIIRYIRMKRCAPVMDPCQTVQHIADHASPAGSAPTVCGSAGKCYTRRTC